MPEASRRFLDSTGLAHFWSKVKDNDVKQSYSEVETVTETETQHVQTDGTLTASPDAHGVWENCTFRITFIGTLNGESYNLELVNSPDVEYGGFWLGYFEDEEGNEIGSESDFDSENWEFVNPVQAQANETYCSAFAVAEGAVVNEAFIRLSGCAFYDEQGRKEPIGNDILVAGSDWHSDLDYTPGNNSDISDSLDLFPTVSVAFPAVGESVTLQFNAWINTRGSIVRRGIIPEAYQNKSITIENVDGINFRLCFLWDTSKDVEVETRSKNLTTTIEKEDDTEVAVSRPISGLLQDLSVTVEESTAIETVTSSGQTYYSVVYLSDSSNIS